MSISAIEVYAVDVGSVAGDNFAWASTDAVGDDIDNLVGSITRDLENGKAIALGFECPLWLPISASPMSLTSARSGEHRSWSSGPGSCALTTGMVELVWILRELRRGTGREASVFLDWKRFQSATGPRLLLWEAYVTGVSKGSSHADDARIAVQAFQAALPSPESILTPSDVVFSIVGAALVHAGWSNDVGLLSKPCLVVKPAG